MATAPIMHTTPCPCCCPTGPEQHEAEELLRCLLERVLLTALHPRTAVTLVLQVLQADGSLLAAAANAACAALADAGLPMASMFGESRRLRAYGTMHMPHLA
jgi:exosome complex RNA-binding protein Rrp42 (RNase PH superfamily)